MRKVTSDIYIEVKKVELTKSTFSIGFYSEDQGSTQAMAYMLAVILKGKGITYGACSVKEIMESLQDRQHAFSRTFVSASQTDYIYTMTVDGINKKIGFDVDFRNPEKENIDFKIMCIQANEESLRIDFNASDSDNLENACHFITMFLRGKGGVIGRDFSYAIFKTMEDAFIGQKCNDVRLIQSDVSYTFKINYKTSNMDINCYLDTQ